MGSVILSNAIGSGEVDEHMATIRSEYKKKREYARQYLQENLPKGSHVTPSNVSQRAQTMRVLILKIEIDHTNLNFLI